MLEDHYCLQTLLSHITIFKSLDVELKFINYLDV